MRNNASSNFLKFTQVNNLKERIYYWNDEASGFMVLNGGGADTPTEVDLTSVVPPTSTLVDIRTIFDTTSTSDIYRIQAKANGLTDPPVMVGVGEVLSGVGITFDHRVLTDSSQKIDYQASGSSTLDIFVVAFMDYL